MVPRFLINVKRKSWLSNLPTFMEIPTNVAIKAIPIKIITRLIAFFFLKLFLPKLAAQIPRYAKVTKANSCKKIKRAERKMYLLSEELGLISNFSLR